MNMKANTNMHEVAHVQITSSIDPEKQSYTLLLSGEIDVTAAEAFAILPPEPPQPWVILDFAHVGKVNSMGLAQLMRLLESWKNLGVRLEARNLNRMVSMLFKMTGMSRYFGAQAGDDTPGANFANISSATGQPARVAATESARSRLNRPKLRRVARAGAQAAEPVAPPADNKMTFSISLQGNQQLGGWYLLNILLQRQLNRPISVSINQLDKPCKLHEQGLVFATPFEACLLILRHHFIPVAQPLDDTDEVSIVCRQDAAGKTLGDFAGASVVTTTESSFVFLLGRFFCDECGLDSAQLQYHFTGNEITAVRSLMSGQADMLFMLSKNYHQLSRIGKEATTLLDESETAVAHHMLLLAPEYAEEQAVLQQTLMGLPETDKGQQILAELGVKRWEVPKEDEIKMLLMLYQRYVGL